MMKQEPKLGTEEGRQQGDEGQWKGNRTNELFGQTIVGDGVRKEVGGNGRRMWLETGIFDMEVKENLLLL